jgi:hypothetical protein
MPIPTVASIRRARRFQDNRRQKAARVITAMERGQTLNLTFTKTGSVFTLSDGTRVASEVALTVINDLRIVLQSDGLFPALPQTWKLRSNLSSPPTRAAWRRRHSSVAGRAQGAAATFRVESPFS